MVKVKLTIAYDGLQYVGWQTQAQGMAVQQKIEQALSQLFPGKPILHSSSRTDTGVHALGMVAHVEIPKAQFRMTPYKMVLAVNAHLPPDIRILSAARCKADFHARFDAKGKQYRYFVWNHAAHSPLVRNQSWHVPKKLNLAAMREAAAKLVGEKDFRAFATNRNYPFNSTVRTLFRCDIRRHGCMFVFVIEGNGFLYKMCRGIVGTLVQVGLGKLQAADMEAILAGKNRSESGMTAPAQGLVLWKVFYHEHRPG